MINTIAVATGVMIYMPAPAARPIPATTHIVAAVVSPSTIPPSRCMIAPAPRKPIPATIPAAIRLGSAPRKPRAEAMVAEEEEHKQEG